MVLAAGGRGPVVRVPVPEELLPADQLGRVHFVGIGGAGLSGIARIMLARGITVSGSDARQSRALEALRALGARCDIGHDASQVQDVDTVVVSTAVREDNPEVVEAMRRGLRLLPRSAALESVMQGRQVVAVAGTHGKTTTTSLLTVALQHCAADPSFAIGGELNESGSNAHDGSGRIFVAEADESDGAFLVYSPYGAIVTNVEADHLDNYGTEEAYKRAFVEFLSHIDRAGFLVACVDDDGAAALAETGSCRPGSRSSAWASPRRPTSAPRTCASRAPRPSSRSSSAAAASVRCRCRSPVATTSSTRWPRSRPGCGSASRSATCAAASSRSPAPAAGWSSRARWIGIRVYDSYAHHPNEIAGDLQAARSLAGEGRVVVAFQPHLVSRTKIFGPAMGEALGAADEVVVMDVYVAREDPEPGVDGGLVASHVPLPRATTCSSSRRGARRPPTSSPGRAPATSC